ncbi:hypothetical protein Cri9333_3576 [Crinalium epipsammum PCC 9333]|uniref:Uncharacterized protein n=1 Tax=Crinalium epipsammum PCC 9333 TaxID=1173022 RepID=K9W3M9_9CYAN|nr:hypothetical protein [Crinalium epipsammum]AFZ14399.1 hypothetical protein Cri9333_3576 [Crinalium epipsammum PCC 9333]
MPEHESEDNEREPQAATDTDQAAVEATDAEEVNLAQGEANSLVLHKHDDLSKFQQKFSHAHQSLERLQKLGEALEHSQISIAELSNQLSKPQSIEIQLAKTEEVTNLQQQAIAQLKELLFGEQQQVEDETVRTLLATIENFMRSQQLELGHLKTELILERAKTKTEKQQLQRELNQTYTDQEALQEKVRSLEAEIFSARSLAGSLEMQLLAAQREIAALQEQLSDRIILLQNQEYQAELQDWKQQCEENQRQIQHLQETLKKLLPDASENLLELLANPQHPTEIETISPVISDQEASTKSHKFLQVDLPNFLKKAINNDQ